MFRQADSDQRALFVWRIIYRGDKLRARFAVFIYFTFGIYIHLVEWSVGRLVSASVAAIDNSNSENLN